VSSSADASTNGGLIDRRVLRGEIWRYWRSAQGQDRNAQWVELVFPVPVVVRGVRVYNPRAGGEANSSITVGSCNVRLYSDAAASIEVAATTTGALAVGGTTATFADVIARSVRIEPRSLGGTFYGAQLAVLGEVEVIARGVEDADLGVVFRNGFE
jgi:hypothetical protein